MTISEYAYLWIPPHGRYFLVGTAGAEHGYLIWDSVTRTALVIEDDDLADEVAARMERQGVPVVARIADAPGAS
ncbi:hypothetical protein [Lentzea cavernae]|nr:hypothetical protein [Lentzea cavernae]